MKTTTLKRMYQTSACPEYNKIQFPAISHIYSLKYASELDIHKYIPQVHLLEQEVDH